MTKRHRYFVVFLLGTLSAFGPLSVDFYLPALPEIQQQIHTTASAAQLTITACLIGLAVGQVIIGPLSDLYGRKLPLMGGLLIFTISSFLAAFVHQIWWLIFLRLLQGLAGSSGQVLSRSIARDVFSGHDLTSFLAVLMSINGIFPIIAPLLGGFVLKVTDWRGIFIILGFIGILLMLAVGFGLKETLMPDNRIKTPKFVVRDIGILLKDRQFMAYALSQGFVYAALYSYISGSSFVFQRIFNMSPQSFSVLYAINGLGIVIVTEITGNLVKSFGERKLLRKAIELGTFFSVILVGSLAMPNNFWVLVISLFLIISLVGMVNTTATSLALQGESKRAGSASALLGFIMNAIGASISPLVGIMGTSQVPMDVLILLSEVAALLIAIFLPPHRTKTARSNS